MIALSIVSIVIDERPVPRLRCWWSTRLRSSGSNCRADVPKDSCLTWLLVVIGLSSVGVLALFAGLDYTRPSSEQTHLGRFVKKLLDGDAGVIFQRKLQANINLLGAIWTWIVQSLWLTWRSTSCGGRTTP